MREAIDEYLFSNLKAWRQQSWSLTEKAHFLINILFPAKLNANHFFEQISFYFKIILKLVEFKLLLFFILLSLRLCVSLVSKRRRAFENALDQKCELVQLGLNIDLGNVDSL